VTDGARVGVDVGGTFTDVVLAAGDRLVVAKLLSTADDYGRAIVDGTRTALAEAGVAPAGLAELVHGTTVATNAILEHRGARTGLLTTRGFRDLLEIRRMRIPRLYDPLWEKPRPLVERALRLEVDERIDHNGEILVPLDERSVEAATRQLLAEGVDAIAVCLLHSYRNASHERRVGEIVRALAAGRYVSLSCDVLPKIKEYERTSTTVLNAYVGPIMERYLGRLEAGLGDAGAAPRLLVMQSGGGVMSGRTARQRPAFAVESGPAAGVIAAAGLGALHDRPDLITLDMGGTTAKASIVEGGVIQYSSESEVGGGLTVGNRLNRGGGYALSVPAIDICEVGAGGGSIAQVDPGGALRVGPRSAGADPGPACYGRGGTACTLTDANVVLGYLPDRLLGGGLRLDRAAAEEALRRDVAEPLALARSAVQGRPAGAAPLPLEEAAWAVHRLAVASMVRVVRAVSSERGRDPRGFALVAFGGNGPVHGAAVAAELGIRRVIVPPHAGLFSAWGLLRAEVEHPFGVTAMRRADGLTAEELEALYLEVERSAAAELSLDGYHQAELAFDRHAELRYLGQSFELRVPASGGLDEVVAGFHDEHERTYGHAFRDQPVEVVDLGVVARVSGRAAALPPAALASAGAPGMRRAHFGPDHGTLDVPALARADVPADATRGPAIVDEYDATVVVPPGWTVRRAGQNLLLEPAE
jgi:N-methylhydantoinase A